MDSRSFEQYQLSCIEERPMGAAMISICQTLYRLDFNNRDECRDFYEDASLWDAFLFCPLTPYRGAGECFGSRIHFWMRLFYGEIRTHQAFEGSAASRKEYTMKVIHTIKELKEYVHQCKKDGKSIGLVTTMGALHEGHASLIQAARKENDFVITSVFVNPTQFGPNEDYEAYPRTLEADAKVAEAAGADLLFAPSPAEMYPHKDMTWVEVTGPITKVLCGRTRPIHFRGVATVCTKFFNLTECDRAYYGLKDAQQTQVLQRMVEDLFMNVELRLMPIVREADGLAKSSRNVYLSKEERTAALVLSRSLSHAKEAFEAGERNKQKLIDQVTKEIEAEPMSDIDYVEMYGMPGLPEVGETIEGQVLLALAVRFGKTRLIDNVILG